MKIKKITYFPIENLFFKPISAHNRLTLYAGVNAILAGIGIWTILRQSSVVLPLDDAYITVHNAQVLLSGRDQNFADAPALLGATSPVHLLFVTGLLPLFGPIVASMIASWFAIMLYATGLARLTFLHGGSIFLAVLVIALGLLAGYAPYQLVNGLETGLAMASVTWALVFASAEQPSRKLALICGLLPFIRPELAILAALLMLRQLGIRWLRREGNFLIVADILLTTGVAAPFVIWSYCSLGALIPSAAAAKEAFFAESFLSSPVKLAWICVGLTQSGILPLGIGLILFKSRLRLIFLLFIATFILSFFLKFPGGLSHNYSRYVFVLLPVLICGFLGEVQKRQQISVALLLAAIFVVPLSYTSVYAYFSDIESMRTNIEDIAAWTDAHIPPNATVLVHDDGFIAYSTNLHLIDIVGLKTPSSAEFHREITAPSGGRLRGMAVCKIAKRANANYAIILNDKGSFWSPLAADLQHCGFTLTTEMRSRSSLEYVIYKIVQPEGGTRPISTVRR